MSVFIYFPSTLLVIFVIIFHLYYFMYLIETNRNGEIMVKVGGWGDDTDEGTFLIAFACRPDL